ncbi:MAG: DNA gyrase inhibitor YacG [Gammaproteobacteria bacterium]
MSKSSQCPTCKKPTNNLEDNQALPFCSERCKLIDFGGWMNGSHAIPGEEVIIIPDEDDMLQH